MSEVNTINGYEIADKKARESLSNMPEPWKVLYQGEILHGNSYEIPDLDKYRLFLVDNTLCVKIQNIDDPTKGYIKGISGYSTVSDMGEIGFLYVDTIGFNYNGNTISYSDRYGNNRARSFELEITNNTSGDAGNWEVKGNYSNEIMGVSSIIGII